MNTRVLVGAFVVVVVVAGAYLALRHAPASVPGEGSATSTAPGAGGVVNYPLPGSSGGSGAPSVIQGAPVKTITHITLAFDEATFTSSSTYPVLSGTGSNVEKAQIEIEDAAGKGIVASEVAIENGRWSYSPPTALAPGTYTAVLGTPGLVVKARLVVK